MDDRVIPGPCAAGMPDPQALRPGAASWPPFPRCQHQNVPGQPPVSLSNLGIKVSFHSVVTARAADSWRAGRRDDRRGAQALTRESGIGVGDAALWDHLGEPLRRAGNRLLLLIVQLARIKEWSLSGPDGELSKPGQAVLVIQLG